MLENLLTGHEVEILIGLGLSLLFGFLIGLEREARGKAAGIGTHCYVIAGAMLFTALSKVFAPDAPGLMAGYIITGAGFLAAGIILKEKNERIVNLTTAANVWISAAIGMAIGFGWYAVAGITTLYVILIPQIHRIAGRPVR